MAWFLREFRTTVNDEVSWFLDKSFAVRERGCGGAPYFRVKRRSQGAGGKGEGNKWDQLRRVFAPSTSERRAEPLSGPEKSKNPFVTDETLFVRNLSSCRALLPLTLRGMGGAADPTDTREIFS